MFEITQLQLWPDDEMPEIQQFSSEDEYDEEQEEAIQDEQQLIATQLYLPGFE
jgi:hypothetical protein